MEFVASSLATHISDIDKVNETYKSAALVFDIVMQVKLHAVSQSIKITFNVTLITLFIKRIFVRMAFQILTKFLTLLQCCYYANIWSKYLSIQYVQYQ